MLAAPTVDGLVSALLICLLEFPLHTVCPVDERYTVDRAHDGKNPPVDMPDNLSALVGGEACNVWMLLRFGDGMAFHGFDIPDLRRRFRLQQVAHLENRGARGKDFRCWKSEPYEGEENRKRPQRV